MTPETSFFDPCCAGAPICPDTALLASKFGLNGRTFCVLLCQPLHMDAARIGEVPEKLLQEKFGVVGEVSVLPADQNQLLA